MIIIIFIGDFIPWKSLFRLPTIMVPLNVLALVTTIAALATSWKGSLTGRLLWSLGLLCLFACTVTFPIYFAGANAEFVTKSVALTNVTSKLGTWSSWHWIRTGLAILAVIFAAWKLYKQEQTDSRLN